MRLYFQAARVDRFVAVDADPSPFSLGREKGAPRTAIVMGTTPLGIPKMAGERIRLQLLVDLLGAIAVVRHD